MNETQCKELIRQTFDTVAPAHEADSRDSRVALDVGKRVIDANRGRQPVRDKPATPQP